MVFLLYLFFCFPFAACESVELAPIYLEPTSPPEFDLMQKGPYKLEWDIDFSPYSGGENLLFATRTTESFNLYLNRKTPLVYATSYQGRMWRLVEALTFWLPINYFAVIVQHELFGHGYRIRDINKGRVRVKGYTFTAPPPYGPGHAATHYSLSSKLTTSQQSAIAMAGVEATAILAELVKLKWLSTQRIDPRQTILYLLAEHDLNLYIGTLKSNDENLDGHDIHSYIQTVNATYTSSHLKKSQLQALAWMNWADPMTFYAIYAFFRYLLCGKETPIPMIGGCYLPNLRLGLTPFGPETYLEQYFLLDKLPIYSYLKGGAHAGNWYAGAGVYAPQLARAGRVHFGLHLDLWRQPKLLLNPGSISIFDIDFDNPLSKNTPLYPYSQQREVRWGVSASVIAGAEILGPWGFEGEFGWKSPGFLPGYSLTSSPTVRLASTLRF